MTGEAIEGLVQRVQALPDVNARGAALELVQAVMDLHREGLERIVEMLPDRGAVVAADPLVSGLLLLHDLHPLDLHTRILQALDRPEFRSVKLISTDGGEVRIRISGDRGVRPALEAVVGEAAPDAASIVIEGAPDFVPLAELAAS